MKLKGKSKTNFKSWDVFEKEMKDIILYGIPGIDKKGHSEDIHFRVIPFQLDIFQELRSLMPNGWLRDSRTGKSINNSILYRMIFMCGCKYFLALIEKNTGNVFPRLHEKMNLLNKIRKFQRQNELTREAEELEDNLLKSNIPKKHELIEAVDKLYEEIKELIF